MPNNALTGLNISLPRSSKYRLGGIAVALGFNTYTASGLNQASVDDATGLVLTVAPGATIIRLEFDENTAMFSDDTKIGNNRYPEHVFGFKYSGRSNVNNDVMKNLDLVRTTWALRTHEGLNVLLGMRNGLISTQGKSGAGATSDDFSGMDYVLTGGETEKALVLDDATFNTLAGRVA